MSKKTTKKQAETSKKSSNKEKTQHKSRDNSKKLTKKVTTGVVVTPKAPTVIDLDEETFDAKGLDGPSDAILTKPLGSEKPTLGMRLHFINVRFPWLKIFLLVLLAGSVAFGMEELLRHNVSQPIGASTDVTVTPNVPEENVPNEPDDIPAKPVEKPPSDNADQPVPEQPSTPEIPSQPSTERKLVALTFDDGPSPAQTPRLLQILKEKGVKATFFAVGNMAQKSPEVLRQEEAEGHEVASHTMTHANLKRSTIEGIKWEVAAIDGIFTDILGHGPSLTRPPYGNINDNVRIYVNQPLILWTVDPEDWRYKDAAVVRKNVVSGAFDGAIILLHDIHATTVDAVAGIVDDLKAAGYEFMTVSELAAARGIVMQNGVSYGSFRP